MKMELNNSEKKRFAEDLKLPITIFEEPYFSYYIEMYNSTFGSKKYLEMFLKDKQNHSDIIGYYEIISQKIIEYFKGLKEYSELQERKIEEVKLNISNFNGGNNLYKKENLNKNLISIDIEKANYNIFRYLFPNIFNKDWKGFCDNFTNSLFFSSSKYIRQIIFGNLNPKRQISIQKNLIHNLVNILIKNTIKEKDILVINYDEIIIEDKGYDIKEIKEIIDKTYNINFRIEKFKLNSVYKGFGFIKEKKDSVEFKNIPTFIFQQFFKLYYNKKIESIDKDFFFNGQIVSFKKYITEMNEKELGKITS